MRESYAVVAILTALTVGYAVGNWSGQEIGADDWRRAVMATDEGCRYAVRDALTSGPFRRGE